MRIVLFSDVNGITTGQVRNRDSNWNYKNWERNRKEKLRSKWKLLEVSPNVRSGNENNVGNENSFCRSVK